MAGAERHAHLLVHRFELPFHAEGDLGAVLVRARSHAAEQARPGARTGPVELRLLARGDAAERRAAAEQRECREKKDRRERSTHAIGSVGMTEPISARTPLGPLTCVNGEAFYD